MLTTFYPPYSFGGDAIGVERLSKALARRGHDVTIVHDVDAFVSLAGGEPDRTTSDGDVRVIGLRSRHGLLSNLLTHQMGKPIVHRRRIDDLLKPGAFDIVWYHNVSLIGGPGLLAMGDGLKIYEAHEHWLVCPTHVLWRHDREICRQRQCLRCVVSYRRPPQIWRYTGMLDRHLGFIDAFIAKSEFSRRKHQEFGFSREMNVVPYFLPKNETQPPSGSGRPHDRPYFLFVGRLEKIKGLDDVIPVFADFPDTDLLIVGDGSYESELRQRAEGISNVIFTGRLSQHQLAQYYEHAIALIVPSVCFETFGIILIESFRNGTPVIARNLGPFGEIVSQCDGGELFANSRELKDAIRRMKNEPDHRKKLANNALSGFKTHWSEDSVMTAYFAVLRNAAVASGDTAVRDALDS